MKNIKAQRIPKHFSPYYIKSDWQVSLLPCINALTEAESTWKKCGISSIKSLLIYKLPEEFPDEKNKTKIEKMMEKYEKSFSMEKYQKTMQKIRIFWNTKKKEKILKKMWGDSEHEVTSKWDNNKKIYKSIKNDKYFSFHI